MKPPKYILGVDCCDENALAYCLVKHFEGSVEVIGAGTMSNKALFEEEVNNLAKYYNAEIVREPKIMKKPRTRCPHPTPIPLYLGDTVEYDQVDELSDTNRNIGVLERTDTGQWIISTANPDRMDYDTNLWRTMKLIKRGGEE